MDRIDSYKRGHAIFVFLSLDYLNNFQSYLFPTNFHNSFFFAAKVPLCVCSTFSLFTHQLVGI